MVADVRAKRRDFYTTRQVATMFGVSIPTVVSWIKSGAMASQRGTKRMSWHYVTTSEVERFKQQFIKRTEKAETIKARKGMTTKELAVALGIRVNVVRYWCSRGLIRSTLVREPRVMDGDILLST
jgi:transposase